MTYQTCKIEGCSRSTEWKERGRKGFCSVHYGRLRAHGDPNFLTGNTVPGDVQDFIRDVAVNFSGSECLTWPFSQKGHGYGQVVVNGRNIGAHRYVCELVKGKPPTKSHLAAHSCGNGHLGCVNPRHLSWKTHAENMEDMVSHGTSTRGERHAMAKLTEESAKEILRMRGNATLREIANKFGVQRSTVSRIHNGHRWPHLNAEREV